MQPTSACSSTSAKLHWTALHWTALDWTGLDCIGRALAGEQRALWTVTCECVIWKMRTQSHIYICESATSYFECLGEKLAGQTTTSATTSASLRVPQLAIQVLQLLAPPPPLLLLLIIYHRQSWRDSLVHLEMSHEPLPVQQKRLRRLHCRAVVIVHQSHCNNVDPAGHFCTLAAGIGQHFAGNKVSKVSQQACLGRVLSLPPYLLSSSPNDCWQQFSASRPVELRPA